jgi:hypothetical protein
MAKTPGADRARQDTLGDGVVMSADEHRVAAEKKPRRFFIPIKKYFVERPEKKVVTRRDYLIYCDQGARVT